MTDRFNCLTVVLDKDIREDDAVCIIDAIRMLKRVISVEGHVTDPSDYIAEERAKRELRKKIFDLLD